MTTYHCTITATFDSHDADFALAAFILWLTDPRHIEEGTVVTTDDDPANPDTIWHGLSLAAKRSWVQAMQPEPPEYPDFSDDPQPLLTEAEGNRLVARYVELTRSNTVPNYDATAAVIEAIDNEDREVLYEMLDVAADMDLRAPDNSERTMDAWSDAIEALLPAVKAALA